METAARAPAFCADHEVVLPAGWMWTRPTFQSSAQPSMRGEEPALLHRYTSPMSINKGPCALLLPRLVAPALCRPTRPLSKFVDHIHAEKELVSGISVVVYLAARGASLDT